MSKEQIFPELFDEVNWAPESLELPVKYEDSFEFDLITLQAIVQKKLYSIDNSEFILYIE